MIRFLGQRILVFFVRWNIAGLFLLVLIELSYGVFGASEIHVWDMRFSDPVLPLEGAFIESPTWEEVLPLMTNSTLVVGISWLVVLLVGYSWGILSARLHHFHIGSLLLLPWLALAAVPSFWWVIQVGIYSYFTWERPGFADEIMVESGPDVMRWWNITVLALPLSVLGISLQMRRVRHRIRTEAVLPFVRGLRQAGYSDSEIFYQNVLRRLRGKLVNLSDETFPLLLGGAMFVEVAFRYEGMGPFLVRSLELDYYPGILVAGLWMAGLVGMAALSREVFAHVLGSD